MKIVNCKILDTDIRFYRDFRRSVLEIHYQCSKGEGMIDFQPNNMEIFILLEKEKLTDFPGAYFRIELDDRDCVKKIINIIDDNLYIEYTGDII